MLVEALYSFMSEKENLKAHTHYDNTPMQYTANFNGFNTPMQYTANFNGFNTPMQYTANFNGFNTPMQYTANFNGFNTPMQYTANFNGFKNDNFSIFSEHRSSDHVRTASLRRFE